MFCSFIKLQEEQVAVMLNANELVQEHFVEFGVAQIEGWKEMVAEGWQSVKVGTEHFASRAGERGHHVL